MVQDGQKRRRHLNFLCVGGLVNIFTYIIVAFHLQWLIWYAEICQVQYSILVLSLYPCNISYTA